MNKKYIIKKDKDIQSIINNSNKIVSKYFVVFYVDNFFNYNRYCISVGKKIGNAVKRNLYKRRIKDILIKNNINFSKDYVIILKNAVINSDYNSLKVNLLKILKGEK